VLMLLQNHWSSVSDLQFGQQRLNPSHFSRSKSQVLYSAYVLDLATTFGFLDHQGTRLGPKKIAAPEVDLLSSGLKPSQHHSMLGTLKQADLEGCNLNPREIVPFRYLRILLTACQCCSEGLDINRHTLFTKKQVSGLVIVGILHCPNHRPVKCGI